MTRMRETAICAQFTAERTIFVFIQDVVSSFSFQLSGSIMVANCVQFTLGATGMVGAMMTYVSPLTVTAYICTGIASLASVCVGMSSTQWGIALL